VGIYPIVPTPLFYRGTRLARGKKSDDAVADCHIIIYLSL